MNVIENLSQAFHGFMYVCNRYYRIEFMNKHLIERIGHDATGELCYKALQGLDKICPWCPGEKVFRGEIVGLEIKSPKDNRWYYIINAPYYYHFNTVSMISMFIDITEKKLLKESLKDGL